MKRSEQIDKIAPLLLQAQKKMGNAVKDAKNPFFKSTYADLNAVREAVIPVYNDLGISVLQPTISENGKEYVETILMHESGQWVSAQTEIVYARAGDPQGQGSGISYARRYGLQAFPNIGAEDDDGERAMERNSTPKTETKKSEPVKTEAKPAEPAKATPAKTTSSFRTGAKKPEAAAAKPAANGNGSAKSAEADQWD